MELGFSSLVGILPEIILIVGGLLILLLDATAGKRSDSGRGFMVISVLFLLIALVGVIFQLAPRCRRRSTWSPSTRSRSTSS